MCERTVGHLTVTRRKEYFAHAGAIEVWLLPDLRGIMCKAAKRTFATLVDQEELAHFSFQELLDVLLSHIWGLWC